MVVITNESWRIRGDAGWRNDADDDRVRAQVYVRVLLTSSSGSTNFA